MEMPPIPWAQHKAHTRAKIVATAVELFEAHGYDEVTVDDIARASGVSPRTIYRYCISKDRIILEDDPQEVPYFMMVLDQQPNSSTIADAILSTIEVLSEFEADDPDIVLRRIRLIVDTPAIHEAWSAQVRELDVAFAEWLAQRAGVPSDDLAVRARAASIAAGYRLLMEVLAERGMSDYLDIAAEIISVVAAGPRDLSP